MNRAKWWWVAALSGCSNNAFDSRGCAAPELVSWDAGVSDGGCDEACKDVLAYGRSCSISSPGVVACDIQCVGGRAPPGLVSLRSIDTSPGSWLARMAELEAAAVQAFIHLSREFDAHGFTSFADAAVLAARDEVRHANQLARLALRFGVAPRVPEIAPSPIRSLDEIVIENAREGCGRELFGAEVNALQARTATDAEVARVMGEITGDEMRHAELSFALSDALMPRVSIATRRQARDAQAEALRMLGDEEPSMGTRAALGLPDRKAAKSLADQLLCRHGLA